MCCSPQGHKESDLTDLLNSNSLGAHHLSTFVTRISLRDIASSCQGIQSTENEKKKIEGKKIHSGLRDGSVVKNAPANAGDTSLIPDQERSHMLQGN